MFYLLYELFIVIQLQFIHLVNQTLNVTHSKQLAHKGLCFEWLKIIKMFSCSNENDGTLCSCNTNNSKPC